MNNSFARDNRGSITHYEALEGGRIDNRTIVNVSALYAWIALAIAGMVCATVLVCHFTPQEQRVTVRIDEASLILCK